MYTEGDEPNFAAHFVIRLQARVSAERGNELTGLSKPGCAINSNHNI